MKNTILGCLTSNAGELFVVLLSLAGGWIYGRPLAITPLLILCVDLVAEMGPLTALTRDPAAPGVMSQQPRNIHDHVLNKHSIIDLIIAGLLMGGIAYALFVRQYTQLVTNGGLNANDIKILQTSTYITVVLCQYANIMSRRAGWTQSVFSSYARSNTKLLSSFVISGIVVLGLIYIPLIASTIGTAPLDLIHRGYGLIGATVFLLAREAIKLFR